MMQKDIYKSLLEKATRNDDLGLLTFAGMKNFWSEETRMSGVQILRPTNIQ